MHRIDAARFDQPAHEIAVLLFRGEIDRRGGAFFLAFDFAQIDRLAEMAFRFADQDDGIAFALEGDGRHAVSRLSTSPTPPMVGVGKMPSPWVSL